MDSNGTSEEVLQQSEQPHPPLFDNVDITSPDDENENDIFESAIQVSTIFRFECCFLFDLIT